MEDMGCTREVWVEHERYGLPIEDMGCIREVWTEHERYGLNMRDMGCLWKVWMCEMSMGCMGVEGWTYGGHG